MNYDEGSLFLKNRNTFIVSMILMLVVFMASLSLQLTISIDPVKIFISIFLAMITFLFNLALGTPGFFTSLCLNVLQLIIYIYSYLLTRSPEKFYMIAMVLLSMILALSFQLFVVRISVRFDRLRRRVLEEQQKRIASERESILKETMQRTALIVKHEKDSENKSIASEAVALSQNMFLDNLTTLPNRAKIIDHLESLIDRKTNGEEGKITIIYVSISANAISSRNPGHRTLDLFTQCMAHRLREYANPSDIVGRVAGNEFVVISDREMSPELTLKYINVLRGALAEGSGTDISGNIISLEDVYAGSATYPENGRFPGVLINNAEVAMRKAMELSDGTNYVKAESPRKDPVFEGIPVNKLRQILEKALADGEIYTVYQPRFDRDRKLTGFETFIRYDSPVYGNVDTYEFLAAAEITGYIHYLGEYVVNDSLEILKQANEIDPSLTVTVNVSAVQLRESYFPDMILRLVNETGCNKDNIILDIPEEVLIGRAKDSRAMLERLSEAGIAMALDNFGRGYSSLNNIPLLPVTLVKLDGHFTSNLAEGSSETALTASIIELLREIDIPVDATGVGTEEQFRTLVSFGCKYFQGKYLCEPLRREQMEDFLKVQVSS